MSDPLGSRKILVTGGGGQLGAELARATCPLGWTVEAKGRDALDFSDLSALSAAISTGRWSAVINAGAYTAVDRAESDALSAWQVNAMAPAALAIACRASGIPLVQVSTDYVFGGEKKSSWEVGDPVNPLGVYGASKLEANSRSARPASGMPSFAPPGSSAPMGIISPRRCCDWPQSATPFRSSAISGEVPPERLTSPPHC